MNFATLDFWILLAGSLLLVFMGKFLFSKLLTSEESRSNYDKITLILIGILLLFYASITSGIIFIIVSLLSFFSVKFLSKLKGTKQQKLLFIIIPIILSPLIYYKYSYFFINQVFNVNTNLFVNIIIPVGISFYTFQKISFVIDTIARKEKAPKFLDFINFAGFFPQVVAGPIERKKDLLPQIQSFRYKISWPDINIGIRYIILGLFFKLTIADNIAMYFQNGQTYNVWQIWLNNILFGLRIYFDFSGYGIIAVGISRCLGIHLTMNFLSPYTARNANEFWRRWHISLTSWFRDYIYINLGGNRTKLWAINIIIVFAISGLWHGSSWNFILWGLFCGLSLIIFKAYSKIGIKLPSFIAWLLTMITCFYIWMFFYDDNIQSLYDKSIIIFNPFSYSMSNLSSFLLKMAIPQTTGLVFSLIIAAMTIGIEFISNKIYKNPYRILLSTVACCAMIFITVFAHPTISNEFIYFAF